MRAITIPRGSGPGFALRDVPVPEPPAGWVRMRVLHVGICGSDIPIFDRVRVVPDAFIPGHETVGEIDALGAGVRTCQVGEKVAVNMVIACHDCVYCRNGRPTLCDTLRELGIHVNGGFAEYVIAPVENLHALPAGLESAQATAVDPLACVYHGLCLLPPRDSDTVVVLGVGPMGLYAIQLARLLGVRRVIAVGRKPGPLTWAKQCGADETIDATQVDLGTTLQRLTGGRGVSYVIEATGAPEILPQALQSASRGGRVLLLGVFHEPVALAPGPIVRGELQLMGSLCYTPDEYAHCLNLLASKRITPIGQRVFGLSELAQALHAYKTREVAKAILEP